MHGRLLSSHRSSSRRHSSRRHSIAALDFNTFEHDGLTLTLSVTLTLTLSVTLTLTQHRGLGLQPRRVLAGHCGVVHVRGRRGGIRKVRCPLGPWQCCNKRQGTSRALLNQRLLHLTHLARVCVHRAPADQIYIRTVSESDAKPRPKASS